MPAIVGIDVGQRICHVAVVRPDQEPVELKSARSKTAALVLEQLAGEAEPAIIAMELTGSLARPIIDTLELTPHRIMIAQHTDSVALRTFTRRRYKTDRLDALLIAELAQLLTNPETAKLIGAYLTDWRDMQRAVKGRIRVRHLQRLTADRARIRTRLKSLTDEVERDHYEQLERELSALIKEAEAALLETAGRPEQLLTSIPGVSLRRACILTGTIGDIAQFTTADNLVAYCGLKPPRRSQSGTKIGRRMRRRATDLLDNELHMFALWVAQNAASGRAGTLGATYTRLKARHQNGIVAMWAVKRQLIRICWGVLNSGEPYRGMETTT